MSVHQHKEGNEPVNCMIITISDTRTAETDKSGDLMAAMLRESGYEINSKAIVPDQNSAIQKEVAAACEDDTVDVILTNGGTGIAHRDVTIETLKQMFDKEISGFGEIFRLLSYQEDIGSAAMLSQAAGGVIGNTAVFAMPGSTGAVKLAMYNLIVPELAHVVRELKKDSY